MNFFPELAPAFWAPASYAYLDGEGVAQSIKFDISFSRLPRHQIKVIEDLHNAQINGTLPVEEDGKQPPKPADADADMLASICAQGWRIKDGEQVKTIPYTRETAAHMEDRYPGFITSCLVAWWQSSRPVDSAHFAAAKN